MFVLYVGRTDLIYLLKRKWTIQLPGKYDCQDYCHEYFNFAKMWRNETYQIILLTEGINHVFLLISEERKALLLQVCIMDMLKGHVTCLLLFPGSVKP